MKKILGILFIVAACVIFYSCEREENPPAKGLSEGEGWLLLNFNASGVVEAQTKAHQSIITESQIFNMYIFIFDKNGNKIYGNFFGNENFKSTADEVVNANDDCWWVKNATTNDNATTTAGTTSGKVRIKAPAGDNYELYILANLDADMVKISSDLLANNIKNKNDLLDFDVYMNAAIVDRSTKFAMSGSADNIKVSLGSVSSPNFPIILERLDAKVKFIFKKGTSPVSGQTISRFEPKDWRVINVPRTAYAIKKAEDHGAVPISVPPSAYASYAEKFFDTDPENFETTVYDSVNDEESYEFAFYMLENRQPIKNAPATYNERSRQLKTGEGFNQKYTVEYYVDGTPYSKEMKLFENANDFSTYVLVTGYVEMDLVNDDAGQILGGDVEYLIHLGDWNAGNSNFNTERNTSYTYTVTVNSVNNIRVEVESSKPGNTFQEPQPGASGSVIIAKEEIAICDAHYVSKTLDFHLVNFFDGGHIDEEHCVADKMTWEVITPFSQGQPVNVGGIDIADHLDYKWAYFRLNKKDGIGNYYSNQRRMYTTRPFATSNEFRTASQNKESAVETDGTYSDGLAGYHNDGVMDIIQLVAYIKQQVKLWLNDPTLSDFDHQTADMSDPSQKTLPKISITVFVNEYYYHEHPITGVEDPYLWKYFVNTNPREIHILCNSEVSLDTESRSTGSVISIKQNPIQTIYNDDLNYTILATAWGTENTDENNHISEYWSQKPGTSRVAGNRDESNGLINTCKEWGLCDPSGTSFKTGYKWHTFMDFEVNNDVPQLNDTYKYLRYSCMARNRDNNGDGIIDRDEVRWYMASIRQLVGFYVGNALLNDETKLYNKSVKDQQSSDAKVWWQHVISSTAMGSNSSNAPELVWAEEGISTGPLKPDATEYAAANSIRCVRNLGNINGNNNESYSLDKQPEDYISYETETDGGYIFTATHLNKEALRYYSSGELISSNERATENRLYKKFAVYKENTGYVSGQTWLNFNNTIDEAIDNKLADPNPFCPDGYRAPNQIELAIMRYYLSGTGTMKNILSRTFYSFGKLGNPVKNDNYGFRLVSTGNVSISDESGASVGTRCVRDIRVD